MDKYTREQNILVYVGIFSYIAIQRGRQDRRYNNEKADVVISHITDLRSIADNGTIGAPAYTNDMQAFHNDSGDIVSLFPLSEAAEGGESQLVSSWWLYNELARSRPDYLRTLAENWTINRSERSFACNLLLKMLIQRCAGKSQRRHSSVGLYFTTSHPRRIVLKESSCDAAGVLSQPLAALEDLPTSLQSLKSKLKS